MSAAASTKQKDGGFPPQIPYIIGNEACERFSFYGMRNILTAFLVSHLLVDVVASDREAAAKEIFHIFVMGVYFFPLLGGWLADRFLGKYRTIFWLSLLYCVGHLCLALFESQKAGFYLGLFLIALGSGGIKPCVSSFVGDQFDQSNKAKARVVFDIFYWAINFGSFFASLLIPLILQHYGPSWAFGVPGLLMALATLVFWLGRKQYRVTPPAPSDPHSFMRVVYSALFRSQGPRSGTVLAFIGVLLAVVSVLCWPFLGVVAAICLALVVLMLFGGIGAWIQLDQARALHPAEAVEGVRAVLRVLVIFGLVTPFWSLFDQKASTWILQARVMELPGWSWLTSASQMQALNPLLVVLLIPFNNILLYPFLARHGIVFSPLRRMTFGIALSGVSWVVVGAFQLALDSGAQLSILWQVLPYIILTLAEVFVSATGLEFAYSQAPTRMKGVIMSFWSLSVTIGSLWVLLVNAGVKSEGLTQAVSAGGISVTAFQMFFFAGFAFVAAAAFGLYVKRYPVADHYLKV
ncbi:POT-type proton-dependent oligopeptide transporter [Oligoflexus tunisiensis]|uniref:POT-type proton-dependent oligopeptide transporter n=1 Tax=Oligoflexus tunisiensis TaxID=708132 RepID=UPI000B3043C6|nr:oligopeptide:H+ symporter [Oligoflexus tunisiensis]